MFEETIHMMGDVNPSTTIHILGISFSITFIVGKCFHLVIYDVFELDSGKTEYFPTNTIWLSLVVHENCEKCVQEN